MAAPPPPKILFLTTQSPSDLAATWSAQQNSKLPHTLRQRGAQVDIRSWLAPTTTTHTLAAYNTITFLCCANYDQHPLTFPTFLRDTLIPATQLNPSLRILNSAEATLWNTDKHYLLDLSAAGFSIPATKFLDLRSHNISSLLTTIASRGSEGPQVLKPSISASGKMTHFLSSTTSPSEHDIEFLHQALEQDVHGDLMLQAYQAGIVRGEYSLVFVAGLYSHAVLKRPREGDFRCQGKFGGSRVEVPREDVPVVAMEAAVGVVRFLGGRFAGKGGDGDGEEERGRDGVVYVRIDGIVQGGRFVVMEVELIEPELWLGSGAGEAGLERLCGAMLSA